jgi:V/A-type H+-transporting ATPase subunit C
MGGVSGYAAVNSRIRVMYSGLITPQVGAGLREAADLASLVTSLQGTAYGIYLKGVEDKGLTPKHVTYQIKNRIADAYLTAIHSAPVNTRSLLVQLFRHFEIDNLKAVLRGIVTNSSWEEVQGILFPLGSLNTLPAQQMLETGSVEAAVGLLTQTAYYETLTHALRRYSDEQSLFPLEVALDLNYWNKLWAGANQLPGDDRAQARRIIGPLVDMTNVLWAIRYRIYYKLSEEEIINYTLPFGYRVRDEEIRSIAAGGDIARVLNHLYPELVNVETLLDDPTSGLPKLELQIQRHIFKELQAVFTGYPFHIGLALAFPILSELEIQDLTVLIEAKAAHMPAEKFTPYLLMGVNSDTSGAS